MEIQLQTNKTNYCFNETICCKVTRTDGSPIGIQDGNFYCGFMINGKTKYYESTDYCNSNTYNFQQSLWDYWDALGKVCEIDFQVEVRLGKYPNVVSAFSSPIRLSVDLVGVEIIRTVAGEESCYVQYKNKIYFVWPGSRGDAKHHRSIAADLATARALGNQETFPHYLVDALHVFRDGILMKNIDSRSFRIHSKVFAGDMHTVLTPYGNAKVVHPEHFEALDNGNCYFSKKPNETKGYTAGYGRDDQHVYWFDSSNSTSHAMIVRACKQPRSFVSLDYGYGKDANNVYLEGRSIKGADPESWRMINRLYSRDKKHVYYLTNKVVDADAETFEVFADPDEKDLFDSMWARDRCNFFERWEKRNEKPNG